MNAAASLRRWVALLAVTGVAVAGCGESDERSLCPAYEDFLAAGAAIAAVDPEEAMAEGASELAEEYLESVRLLQESADGRYGTELAALETAVNDVLLTLDSVEDTADYSTWAPLVEDSLEVAADAAVTVEDAIEPSCSQSGSRD